MDVGSTDDRGAVTVECAVHFERRAHGRIRLRAGPEPTPDPETEGKIPHVTKLLALAHHLDGLLREGAVANYAELARLAGVSRARITQIMDLLLLAPDIQEEILFLPRVTAGRDPVTERDLRPLTSDVRWSAHRRAWRVR